MPDGPERFYRRLAGVVSVSDSRDVAQEIRGFSRSLGLGKLAHVCGHLSPLFELVALSSSDAGKLTVSRTGRTTVSRTMTLFALAVALIPASGRAVEIYHHFPEAIHPDERYVVYSHGLIAEGDDPKPISPKYGQYDFSGYQTAESHHADRILQGWSVDGGDFESPVQVIQRGCDLNWQEARGLFPAVAGVGSAVEGVDSRDQSLTRLTCTRGSAREGHADP